MKEPSQSSRAGIAVLTVVVMLGSGSIGAGQSPPTRITGLSQLVHVTPDYSNAVLRALLPHFAQFSEKTQAVISDLPRPLTIKSVQSFRPNPTAGVVGGRLTLTNGSDLWFGNGVVDSFNSPRNFFYVQDFSRIPEFYGKWNMSESEAIQLAEKTIQDLGYAIRDVTHGWPRMVIPGGDVGTNKVPFIEIRWENPDDQFHSSVMIDAENKAVVGLFLSTSKIKKSPPKIDVIPELLIDYRKRIQRESRGVDQQGSPARPQVEPKRLDR